MTSDIAQKRFVKRGAGWEYVRRCKDKDSDELQGIIQNQIAMMESEHRDLDSVIEQLGEVLPFDQLKLQRLKKRKLVLKDEMAKLQSRILPDIIA